MMEKLSLRKRTFLSFSSYLYATRYGWLNNYRTASIISFIESSLECQNKVIFTCHQFSSNFTYQIGVCKLSEVCCFIHAHVREVLPDLNRTMNVYQVISSTPDIRFTLSICFKNQIYIYIYIDFMNIR